MEEKINIKELREHCIKNNLDFLAELTKRTSRKEEVLEQKPHPQEEEEEVKHVSRLTPESIIVDKLKELNMQKDVRLSLDAFVDSIKPQIEKLSISYLYNCPLQDFVANILYDYAENTIFGEGKSRYDRMKREVTKEDLKQALFNRLDDSAIRHILGELDSEYVRKHYTLNESLEFKNKRNEIDVGGAVCWNGSNKKQTRNILFDYVKNKLLPSISANSDTKKSFVELQKEIEDLKRKSEKLRNRRKDCSLEYEVSARDGGILYSFIKYFVHSAKEKRKINVEVTDYQKNDKDATLKFKTSEDKVRFFGEFDDEDVRRKCCYLKKISVEALPTQEETSTKAHLEQLKMQFKLDDKKSNPVLKYIGLEGPNFCSYFQLFKLLKENNIDLNAYIPEYHNRSYNIMKSIKKAGFEPLNNTKLKYGYLDDLLLLDFPDDLNVILKDNDTVNYKNENLSLDKYHEIIDELNKGAVSKEMSSKFDISQDFAKAISNRYEGKFDIAYLDFNGPMSEKRSKAFQYLVKNRLSDNAVVAMTINANPGVNRSNPQKNLKNKLLTEIMGTVIENKFDLDINDLTNPMEYKDSSTPMIFVPLYLTRKKNTK